MKAYLAELTSVGHCLTLKRLSCQSCAFLNATGTPCVVGEKKKCQVQKECICKDCNYPCQFSECERQCAKA